MHRQFFSILFVHPRGYRAVHMVRFKCFTVNLCLVCKYVCPTPDNVQKYMNKILWSACNSLLKETYAASVAAATSALSRLQTAVCGVHALVIRGGRYTHHYAHACHRVTTGHIA